MFSEKDKVKRSLPPPVRASWARLLEAVNVTEGINPAAVFGPQDSGMSRFKTAVYEQVSTLLRKGKLSYIRAFNRVADKAPLGLLSENPFHWTIFALSKSDELDRKIHPAQVRQLGLQLNYAYRHRIPSELLIGFLHQTGCTGSEKQKWIADNPDGREWWFEEFIDKLRSLSAAEAMGYR